MKTPLHVLMVEDSADDAKLLLREISRGNWHIIPTRVETADQMHAALRQQEWDVVLCDYALPHFSGEAALKLLKDSGRDLPFIFVSGTIGEDVAVAAMKAGAHDYVMKDNLTRLVGAVDRELRDAVDRRLQRVAEDQVRISEHKYRHLFQNMSDAALLIARENDRIIDANEQAGVLFGQTRDEILGQPSARLFPPLEAGPTRDAARPDGNSWETVAQRKDRTLVPVQVSVSHVELNERPFLLALFRDISNRKQAEAALRTSEERLSTVFHLSPTPIAIVRVADNKLIDVNEAFCRGTGYLREELVGHTPDELRLWPEPAERDAILQELQAKGTAIACKLHGRRKSGEIGVGLGSLTQIPLNGEPHLLWLILDISEQEQAEKARHESDQRFRQVTENIDEVFWLTDATRQEMVYISPAYQCVFGRTCESLYARSGLWAEAVHPDDRPRFHRAVADLPHTGGYNLEYRIVRPDDTVRWIHDRAFPIRNAAGEIYRIAGVTADITARHQLEGQLRQAQKMESLGTLAGGIAHDFNNILTGVLGSAEVARLELPPDHPAARWLQNITLGGNRARDLIQQIMTFGRKHEGDMVPRKLQVVVNEALRLLRSTIPTMVVIEARIDSSCPPVLADDTQIHQVVMNLCTNAWHALPEQGGRIGVTLAPVQVTPEMTATRLGLTTALYVRLSVRDNGRGMTPEILARIFEPFFTTKPQGHGTGLGLAVVHGIVQSHHGAIFVQSSPGAGTLFELFLPALTSPESGGPLASEPVKERGHGESILLVDDDPTALAGLRAQLEHLGYRITAVSNSRSALELFQAGPGCFDLVLTDYAMPDLSGPDFASRLLAVRPDLPVILASGLIDTPQVQRVHALGVREVIRKPIPLAELARLLAQQLHPQPPS